MQVFFKAADVVILPYKEGSTSGVLKVAMAFGVPAIATKVGELPEAVINNNAGMLIDLPLTKKDVDTIVGLLTKASEQQSSVGTDHLSWKNIAGKTLKLYESFNET